MPWQWACLVCNATWSSTSPAAHTCTAPSDAFREFWFFRLRWSPSLRGQPEARVRALVARPINRSLLVELLGASWDPAGDDAARMPCSKPREAAA